MAEIQYINLGDIYGKVAAIQGAELQNKLARMQQAEYEKKMAREANRNAMAQKYYTPGQPAQAIMGVPQESTNAMSLSAMNQPQMTPSAPIQAQEPANLMTTRYQPSTPGQFDMQGYQQGLYQSGDVEGATGVQAQVDAQKEKAFTMNQKELESRMQFYKPIMDAAIKEGNNDVLQQVLSNMKKDSVLSKLLPPDFAVSVTPTGETETVLDVKEGMPGPDGQPLLDPYTKQPLAPGRYKIKAKGTQILKVEPFQGDMPYKAGERQKFTGKDGNEYEGTFKGMDDKGEPIFTNTVKVNKPASGTQTDFRNESAMRKEFLSLPEVKEYPTIEMQSKRALKALQDTSGNKVAVDQSVITTFNKMLDPTSVVRESEYARTPQDMALLNRIKGKWEKITSGGAGLTDDERQAMYRMITAFKEVADAQYNEQVDYYSGLAKRYGFSAENIVRLGGKKMGGDMPTGTGKGATRPKPKF